MEYAVRKCSNVATIKMLSGYKAQFLIRKEKKTMVTLNKLFWQSLVGENGRFTP